MIRFIAGRMAQGVIVVLAVATLTFVLLHAAPGDPVTALGEASRVPPQVREQMRRDLGLDQPLSAQYVRFLGDLLRGDLGYSISLRRPVWDELREAIPPTLLLAGTALLLDFSLGIGLGLAQAARAGRRFDRLASVATLTLYSVPIFWLGLMLSLVFGQWLGWLPIAGMRDPVLSGRGVVSDGLDLLRHLLLPATTLAVIGAASTARFQRAALLDVVHQDFVRTARAKGLAERVVWTGHALRNALLPTITLLGLSLPMLLSGAVLVETIYSWPGLGRLATDAIFRRDYPVVTGAAILAAAMVVAGSLLSDLLYRVADPRTREAA